MKSFVEMHEEEVVNPEPLRFIPDPEKDQKDVDQQDQTDYTPGETEYADGEGTRLDREIEKSEDDDARNDDRGDSEIGHA